MQLVAKAVRVTHNIVYRSHRSRGNVKIHTVAQIHTGIPSAPFIPYTPTCYPSVSLGSSTPSRKTVTSRLENVYDDGASDLHTQIASAKKVSLTTDAWTALTTESNLTITTHYINERCTVLFFRPKPCQNGIRLKIFQPYFVLTNVADHWYGETLVP